MSETKICTICNEEKELSEFYSQKKHSKPKGDYIYHNPECKECTKKKAARWQKDNPNKKKKSSIKYEKTKKGKLKNKKYTTKIITNGQRKEWVVKNRDKVSNYTKNRYLNKMHKITVNEWKSCKEYFDNSCAYCGFSEEEHRKLHNQDLHKEHVDHNGANDLSNCVPSCRVCNSKKHIFELCEWYNDDNENFSNERLEKIHIWLDEDYKKFIKNN